MDQKQYSSTLIQPWYAVRFPMPSAYVVAIKAKIFRIRPAAAAAATAATLIQRESRAPAP